MNHPIRLKTAPPLLITLTLLCFGLLPRGQAVVPPPDGGYPGFNTAEGQKALFTLTTGQFNTAVGALSLGTTTVGYSNTAVGAGALLLASGADAYENTAVGAFALLNNTGLQNTAIGMEALGSNTTGLLNTAIGDDALTRNTTGSFNTAIGPGAGFNVTDAHNVICIGIVGQNVSDSCYINNIYGTFNTAQSAVVYIDPDGRLGTGPSARRFKKDIADMGAASEVLLSMRPVTFHFKTQDTEKIGREISQFGLIAEEVAEVNPDLILRNKEGEIYSVRYDAVNAMLLNEFQKEHRKNEEQGATIAQLKQDFQSRLADQQKQIEALTTRLQKVSAQLEASQPASQMVNNP